MGFIGMAMSSFIPDTQMYGDVYSSDAGQDTGGSDHNGGDIGHGDGGSGHGGFDVNF
jgi:hypothetical protein